jgi:ribosomal protein S18 acetylase RimI-like enzyme
MSHSHLQVAGTMIRQLSDGDEGVFDAVHDDVFDDPIRPEGVRAFLQDPNSVIVVALDADVVVGMVTAQVYAHPDKPLQLWINELGVAEPFRRRGIARALMTMVLQVGRARGCAEAWVATDQDNAPAHAVYGALGGQIEPEPAVIFTFPLAPDSEM